MERLRRWWLGEEGGRPPAPNAAWRLSDLLAGEAPGFARAEGPRPFAFPRDHGPHEGFRTEWWYFTGHLRASDGIGKAAREFGYQLTFFRFGLVPPGESAGPSRWAARHVYMAHFAVADVAAGVFRAYERLGRGALGIAGSAPGRVWIDEWSLAGPPWPLRLRAGGPEYGIDLRLAEGKPIVLQGDRPRVQPQIGPRGQLLLLRAPDAHRGAGAGRGRAIRSTGGVVVGSGVGERYARARSGGLGLVRTPTRRRARADGLPAAPEGRLDRSPQRGSMGRGGRRDAAPRGIGFLDRGAGRMEESAHGGGLPRAVAGSGPPPWTWGSISFRVCRTRSWPSPSATGKARCPRPVRSPASRPPASDTWS